MQPTKDIKSNRQLLLPPTRRPLNSIYLVLHSVKNAYQRFQLQQFTIIVESRAKPRLVPNSRRTTANFTFPPAQVSIFTLDHSFQNVSKSYNRVIIGIHNKCIIRFYRERISWVGSTSRGLRFEEPEKVACVS